MPDPEMHEIDWNQQGLGRPSANPEEFSLSPDSPPKRGPLARVNFQRGGGLGYDDEGKAVIDAQQNEERWAEQAAERAGGSQVVELLRTSESPQAIRWAIREELWREFNPHQPPQENRWRLRNLYDFLEDRAAELSARIQPEFEKTILPELKTPLSTEEKPLPTRDQRIETFREIQRIKDEELPALWWLIEASKAEKMYGGDIELYASRMFTDSRTPIPEARLYRHLFTLPESPGVNEKLGDRISRGLLKWMDLAEGKAFIEIQKTPDGQTSRRYLSVAEGERAKQIFDKAEADLTPEETAVKQNLIAIPNIFGGPLHENTLAQALDWVAYNSVSDTERAKLSQTLGENGYINYQDALRAANISYLVLKHWDVDVTYSNQPDKQEDKLTDTLFRYPPGHPHYSAYKQETGATNDSAKMACWLVRQQTQMAHEYPFAAGGHPSIAGCIPNLTADFLEIARTSRNVVGTAQKPNGEPETVSQTQSLSFKTLLRQKGVHPADLPWDQTEWPEGAQYFPPAPTTDQNGRPLTDVKEKTPAGVRKFALQVPYRLQMFHTYPIYALLNNTKYEEVLGTLKDVNALRRLNQNFAFGFGILIGDRLQDTTKRKLTQLTKVNLAAAPLIATIGDPSVDPNTFFSTSEDKKTVASRMRGMFLSPTRHTTHPRLKDTLLAEILNTGKRAGFFSYYDPDRKPVCTYQGKPQTMLQMEESMLDYIVKKRRGLKPSEAATEFNFFTPAELQAIADSGLYAPFQP